MNDKPKALSISRPEGVDGIVIRRGKRCVILRYPLWLSHQTRQREALKRLVESGVLQ